MMKKKTLDRRQAILGVAALWCCALWSMYPVSALGTLPSVAETTTAMMRKNAGVIRSSRRMEGQEGTVAEEDCIPKEPKLNKKSSKAPRKEPTRKLTKGENALATSAPSRKHTKDESAPETFKKKNKSEKYKGTEAPVSKGSAPASKGSAPASKGSAPASKGAAPASKGAAPASKGAAGRKSKETKSPAFKRGAGRKYCSETNAPVMSTETAAPVLVITKRSQPKQPKDEQHPFSMNSDPSDNSNNDGDNLPVHTEKKGRYKKNPVNAREKLVRPTGKGKGGKGEGKGYRSSGSPVTESKQPTASSTSKAPKARISTKAPKQNVIPPKKSAKESKSMSKIVRPTTAPHPTMQPSRPPKPPVVSTSSPTASPTANPPTPTDSPVEKPTTSKPSRAPTTSKPSRAPATSKPSRAPSRESFPTVAPSRPPVTTDAPTSLAPTTFQPTQPPTRPPTRTRSPRTVAPTRQPSTATPTTLSPTAGPTQSPTPQQTEAPTSDPTLSPTSQQTGTPTSNPTDAPTSGPTLAPVVAPTSNPTRPPTTASPTEPGRTLFPTAEPINYLQGFPCSNNIFASLNSNPVDSGFPRFERIDSSDPESLCYLRMTPNDGVDLATSAFLGVPVQDPATFSFKMTIGYRIYGDSDGSADGMVFVMHQDERGAQAAGNGGGGIGVYGPDDQPEIWIKPSLTIEWDTFENPQRLDVGEDNVHVIQVDSNAAFRQLAQSSALPIRTDDAGTVVGRMWVQYNCGGDNALKIWNNNEGDFQGLFPDLQVNDVNLEDFFFRDGDQILYVGYTASIGGQSDSQDIFGWEFSQGC